VIDDEEILCRTISRMLTPHDVDALTDPREALARLSAGSSYDVILCDLAMPELTGIELHATLARQAPDLAARMVFMSGGATDPETRAFLAHRPVRHIDKPFRRATLLALIDSLVTPSSAT